MDMERKRARERENERHYTESGRRRAGLSGLGWGGTGQGKAAHHTAESFKFWLKMEPLFLSPLCREALWLITGGDGSGGLLRPFLVETRTESEYINFVFAIQDAFSQQEQDSFTWHCLD